MYDKLMQFVEKHLPDKFYLEGDLRISLRDKIFREVIANILIHREYTNAFPTMFYIYKGYVKAKNANKPRLHGMLTPQNLLPFPKNPCIAQLFTQMGRSEELGTGIRNVFKYSKAYSGSDKVSFSEEDVFVTQVPLIDVTDNVTDNVTDRKAQIIFLLKENNAISTSEMARKLKVSKRTVLREIDLLKTDGLIKREGSEKTGYWLLNEQNIY